MSQGFRRVGAAMGVGAVLAVLAASPATAAGTGVGSASGGATLVGVQLGSATPAASNPLTAMIVGESNATSIDSAKGTPSASQTLSALNVTSGLLPALDALSVTPAQTSTTGAQDQKTTSAVDLGAIVDPVAPGVLSGTVNPATLSSIVDANGAKSTLASTLTDLSILTTLARIHSSSLNTNGNATPTGSLANRSVTVDGVTLLNLDDLLNLLGGVSLSDLDPLVLADLVDQMGLTDQVGTATHLDLTKPGDLADAISTIQTAISSADLTICDSGGLLFEILGSCANVGAIETELQSIIGDILTALQSAPLLSIGEVNAGVHSLAVDTTDNSEATVAASIASIRVAGLGSVGPIDLTQSANDIKSVVDQVNEGLHNILNTIEPALADFLKISVFDANHNVFADGDYVKSAARVTALTITITPPDLCDFLDALPVPPVIIGDELKSLTTVDVKSVLATLGQVENCGPQVPAFIPAALGDDAPGLTEGDVVGLVDPLVLNVASVNSAAEFKVTPATAPPGEELSRTGMNTTLLLLFGGLMVAVAIGARRVNAAARATDRRD